MIAAAAFLRLAGMGELQTELRLADARRADDDGQRAGNQPAAEQIVEAGNAGRLPSRRSRRRSFAARLPRTCWERSCTFVLSQN